ncbi:CDP-alcohol phosphatidyltransferase-domain-containing protein [Phakopsora pachyrhizi]|uniref:CDP-alcohol phosphatidyltransferase-domain-containing protein n=1 Tax=Phakopsora pachyrhizi TaxID=170000 RepID=A0AAV0B7F2_PHAPC|nr:CDP-alcohol phosphatidyltransferase-domain-containing protein [Phakopsora pachyrhizi]CAH7681842.1 CDP-alcohol phosphatidyltransferase-domain-containing protein [Phakopsora pachyrhizi]
MICERPHYIPRDRRSNLSRYRYSGSDNSIISRYVLTPYWNRLVLIFPTSVAPNLITLTGLGFVMINFICLMIYEPDLWCSNDSSSSSSDLRYPSNNPIISNFKSFIGIESRSNCPSGWLYFSFALGLWIYQSLDAIDGKQARRTGTSGPLGELFDHGCDALNTTLGCILASASLNLGFSWWTVASQVSSLASFYLTTWEEYHTGTLYLSSFSGPVEGILLVIAVFSITSLLGPTFWDQGILNLLGLSSNPLVKALNIRDLQLNQCSLLFAIISLAFNTVGSYLNVTRAKKGSSRLSNLKTLLGLQPFVIQTVLNMVWLYSQPGLLQQNLIGFMIYYGLGFAHLVGLMIVSHIVKAPEIFPYWNLSMVWSLFGVVDSNLKILSLGRYSGPLIQVDENAASRFIWLSVVVVGIFYGYFVFDVILDICDYCDICLSLSSPFHFLILKK